MGVSPPPHGPESPLNDRNQVKVPHGCEGKLCFARGKSVAEICGIMRKPSDPRIPPPFHLLCGHIGHRATGGLDPDLDRAPSFPFWNDQRTGSIRWGVDSDCGGPPLPSSLVTHSMLRCALCQETSVVTLGIGPRKGGLGSQPGPPPDHRLLPSFPHAADTTGGTVPRVRSRARRPGESVRGRRVVGLGEM